MVNLHLEVLDFVVRANRHASLETLVADFEKVAEKAGFGIFILTGLPKADLEVEPLVLANKWPVEWSDRYREGVYFPDDPVSQWSMTKRRPFRWREAQTKSVQSRRTFQIAGEAWEHGLADGIAFPLRQISGGAVVSLAAEANVDLDPKAEASLFLAASYFNFAAQRIVGAEDRPPRLTPREREILTWTAAGKTSWETSAILSVSESTIKSTLARIREKFGVANTTQAISAAILRGEITP